MYAAVIPINDKCYILNIFYTYIVKKLRIECYQFTEHSLSCGLLLQILQKSNSDKNKQCNSCIVKHFLFLLLK
jgi:hypothetical protein